MRLIDVIDQRLVPLCGGPADSLFVKAPRKPDLPPCVFEYVEVDEHGDQTKFCYHLRKIAFGRLMVIYGYFPKDASMEDMEDDALDRLIELVSNEVFHVAEDEL